MPLRRMSGTSQKGGSYGSSLTRPGYIKYPGARGTRPRQIVLTHNMAIVSGTPQQLPSFKILPGMEAVVFAGHLAAVNDHLYLAKNPRPRAAANTPGAGAIQLSGNGGTGGNSGVINLDGGNLSEWFVDSDGADFLNIMVYENRDDQFI